MIDVKVTYLRGNMQTPRAITLPEAILKIKQGEFSDKIIEARALMKDILPFAEVDVLKKIPVVIFSCCFGKNKGIPWLKAYNGIVLLEICNLVDREELEQLKRMASFPPQTIAVFTGVSGKSLKILIGYKYPDGSLPENEEEARLYHEFAYRKAATYYNQLLFLPIEPKEPLLERGCRLSYDPHLYFNPHAIPVIMEQPFRKEHITPFHEMRRKEKNPYVRMEPGLKRSLLINRVFENCWDEALAHTGNSLNGENIEPFLTRLVENGCKAGLLEEEIVRWCMVRSPINKQDVHDLRKLVSNIYNTQGITGKETAKKRSETSLAEHINEFMKQRYMFRYNLLKDDVEYREVTSYYFSYKTITERDINTITYNMHMEGISVWDRDIKRYIYSNQVPTYNPVDDYFSKLPPWDGTDHIRHLANRIPTEREDWADKFYIWFLGMVAQWNQKQGIHANSTLPLLIGEQGCGKSTFCRLIIPPELRNYYMDYLDLSNTRNAELTLSHYLLINMDEFDSIPTVKQSYLKHILQKPEINNKRPYKKSFDTYHRFASFIATCNNYDLLTDPTGSRRFIGVDITGRIDYASPVNYAQLYAQAKEALKAGERWWYTPEEEASITYNNRQFQQLPVEEQLFHQYFQAGVEGNGVWLSALTILDKLERRSKRKISNRSTVTFGRILKKNKIQSRHTYTGNLYFVTERSDPSE